MRILVFFHYPSSVSMRVLVFFLFLSSVSMRILVFFSVVPSYGGHPQKTPKNYQQRLQNRFWKASGRLRGATSLPRAAPVATSGTTGHPKWRQEAPRGRPEGHQKGISAASCRSFSPLGATFGHLGSTFMGDLTANRFFIDFLKTFYRFQNGFWMRKRSRQATQQQKGGNAKSG